VPQIYFYRDIIQQKYFLAGNAAPENRAKIDTRQGKIALREGNFDSENCQRGIGKGFV